MDIALLTNLQGGNQASATNLGNAGETRGGKNADDSASPFANLLGKRVAARMPRAMLVPSYCQKTPQARTATTSSRRSTS